MRTIKILMVILLVASFIGCAGMSAEEQRALSGGAIGAGAGALGAGILGKSPAAGAAIGGAAGAAGGYLYEKSR